MGVDIVGVSRWLEMVVVVDVGVGVLSYGEIVPCVGVVVDGGVGVDVGVSRRHRIGYCRDRRGSRRCCWCLIVRQESSLRRCCC